MQIRARATATLEIEAKLLNKDNRLSCAPAPGRRDQAGRPCPFTKYGAWCPAASVDVSPERGQTTDQLGPGLCGEDRAWRRATVPGSEGGKEVRAFGAGMDRDRSRSRPSAAG